MNIKWSSKSQSWVTLYRVLIINLCFSRKYRIIYLNHVNIKLVGIVRTLLWYSFFFIWRNMQVFKLYDHLNSQNCLNGNSSWFFFRKSLLEIFHLIPNTYYCMNAKRQLAEVNSFFIYFSPIFLIMSQKIFVFIEYFFLLNKKINSSKISLKFICNILMSPYLF